MAKKTMTKKYRVIYARYSWGADALGNKTSYGMEIMDSQKRYIGYMPYTHWIKSGVVRNVSCHGLYEKCMVKLLSPRKR